MKPFLKRYIHAHHSSEAKVLLLCSLYGLRREKNLSSGLANNKGADQPAHPRSQISAFVIRLLKRIISRLATSEISLFYLGSVAEETGLSLALSETPKTGFLASRPICVRAVKAMATLCRCTGSSKPWLLADALSTKTS